MIKNKIPEVHMNNIMQLAFVDQTDLVIVNWSHAYNLKHRTSLQAQTNLYT